jgi:hypothetical protein
MVSPFDQKQVLEKEIFGDSNDEDDLNDLDLEFTDGIWHVVSFQ